MKSNRQEINLLILWIMVMSFISACQSLPLQSPEQVLQNRVTRMMAARGNQNWAEVYEYLAPDYQNRISQGKFVGMPRNVLYGDFVLESIKIGPSGNEAVVTVKYDMTVMSFDVKGRSETQEWVKTGGKWYYQMKVETIFD